MINYSSSATGITKAVQYIIMSVIMDVKCPYLSVRVGPCLMLASFYLSLYSDKHIISDGQIFFQKEKGMFQTILKLQILNILVTTVYISFVFINPRRKKDFKDFKKTQKCNITAV